MKDHFYGFIPDDVDGVKDGTLGAHSLRFEILDLDNTVKQIAGRTLSAYSPTGLTWADRTTESSIRKNPITEMLLYMHEVRLRQTIGPSLQERRRDEGLAQLLMSGRLVLL